MKNIISKTLVLAILATLCLSQDNLKRPVITQKLVDEINNNPNSTWKAGFNSKFSTASVKDVLPLLGTIKSDPAKIREYLPLKTLSEEELTLTAIPESYDLREANPKCESIKEVRDQATCGSCWAFGAAEVMSDRICIKSKGQDQTRVSTENILSCCNSCGFGCNGGYPFAAFRFWSNGIVTGGLYNDNKTCQPYAFPPCDHHTTGQYEPCGPSKPTPKCEHKCVDGYSKSYEEDKTYGSAYSIGSSEREIQIDIMTSGSIECAFTVYDDFMTYKSGVYQPHSKTALGGHAIKIIGWGVENGTKYWLIANSWNEDWGEKGFFRYIRGNNTGGMEEECVAGIPKARGNLDFLQ